MYEHHVSSPKESYETRWCNHHSHFTIETYWLNVTQSDIYHVLLFECMRFSFFFFCGGGGGPSNVTLVWEVQFSGLVRVSSGLKKKKIEYSL